MKYLPSVFRFDVDVPGGRVYKESSFTEAGKFNKWTNEKALCTHLFPYNGCCYINFFLAESF